MAKEALVVRTPDGFDEIVQRGVLGPFRVSGDRLRAAAMIVVVQNRERTGLSPSARHNEAFMLAEIEGVERDPDAEPSSSSFRVFIRNPKPISIEGYWHTSHNPVRFVPEAEVKNLLQDLTKYLNKADIESTSSSQPRLLDIPSLVQRARREIAAAAGVDAKAVRVTITIEY